METPKVSVIVPVYNLDKYVGECVGSLLKQETSFNYEIVAVDDASTDDSYQILKALEKEYNTKLKVYRNKQNMGLAKTMKRLLSLSKGQYIAYLDGDDLALPGKLQQQADYLDKHKDCTIVYHESDVFDSDTNKTLWIYTKDYYNKKYIAQKASVKDVLKYGCFMQASTVMVRRHNYMLEAVDEQNKILLDHPWHVLNLIYGKGSIDFIDQLLGRYRIHKDSFGAKTLRSVNRRIQVLDDQLHVCDLASLMGIETSVINKAKGHYYFATALYFLRAEKFELFKKYIKDSTDGQWFFNSKHKQVWDNMNNPHYLKDHLYS